MSHAISVYFNTKNTVAFHNETVHNNKQLKMKTLLSFFIKFLVLVLNGK